MNFQQLSFYATEKFVVCFAGGLNIFRANRRLSVKQKIVLLNFWENAIICLNMNEMELLFSAGDEKYLINSALVKEIVRNQFISPVPFLPDYINGVISYFGNLYTVIDFSNLIGGPHCYGNSFLILNSSEDIVFRVDSVEDFYSFADFSEDFQKSASGDGFYKGSISFSDLKKKQKTKDENFVLDLDEENKNFESPTFLINLEAIVKKIKSDLLKI